ncbi:DNA polymerase III subunit beta [Ochrobactrum sp. 695/2009]|nr:DNA polymerase III subunit beta [Brucella intermedia]PJR89985.1 DNA polymerase III subunit beta [Ochrobactrum sp. 721/2009]PJT14202.1 DNA polymerase III subunit beta [Ochrobactrum sp. 720/2009]PJT24371.1 DNA polymerase III subunit beta [Ochrobactrum sp. 715/2009]PJT30304.1 DNA polymerase III subunit beta [Ochrobactrum sp. 695/2009]PJT33831.1 DNA polymerase III subunit beta [Ochrobactrum sp. 689/2009]
MRVSIDRSQLAHALATVNRAIESRNSIPILANVLLAVEDGQVRLTGTDLDVEITTSLPVLDCQPGSVTAPGKMLADIAKRATGDVTLELDGGRLTVASGRSRYKLDVLPAEDFPSFSAGEFDTTLELDLAALVAPCVHCISTDETRYYLAGVYLHAVDARLVAVATDGHRLMRNVGPAGDLGYGVILPRNVVGLLPKGAVTLELSQNKVRVTSGPTVITSKLIDGTFPDYVRVIPTGNANVLTVDRQALMKAVERVAAVADDKSRAVKFAVGDVLRLMLADKASDEVSIEFEGEPLEIGFNARYVNDMLGALDEPTVRFALGDAGSTAVVNGEGEWTGVLMPMRV